MTYCLPCEHNLKSTPIKAAKKTSAEIMEIASVYFGMSINRLKMKCRKRDIVEARQLTQTVLVRSGFNNRHIGRLFGQDRTTVYNSEMVVMDLCFYDAEVKRKYEELLSIVNN